MAKEDSEDDEDEVAALRPASVVVVA